MSSENPYEGSLGTGGKFRKQQNRRAKPYDRPPAPPLQTSLRTQSGSSSSNNGWISKLVDPAHRLINAGAHRLFGSIFRKRLTQTPHNPEPPEIIQEETEDQYQDAVSSPKNVSPGAITGGHSSKNSSDRGGIMELEQVLKQKTFTRSEIDRLTALLHSKTVDMPVEDEERKSRTFASSQSKDKFSNPPVIRQENGDELRLTSTPAVERVLDEDVASPADLAKAYMGSKTSKVSPSKLGLRSQAMKDDPNMLGMQHFPQKSSRMALVPRAVVNAGVPSNGIITRRPRGRSALYSMAQTPYAMGKSISASKHSGHTFDSDAGPSSSSAALPTWNDDKFSASKQGSLKRRSSLFDNDIGSVGPIRRIRQKYNLLSSRKLSQPLLKSSLSVPRLATGGDALGNSSAMSKSNLSIVPDDNVPKGLKEDGNVCTAVPDSTPVSSKSSEMASRILQQLDKLVSSKEKSSPTKMPPSMLNDSVKNVVQSATARTSGIKSFAPHPPKNQAFHMSEHEVSLELDDHSNQNGVVSSPSVENKGNPRVSETDRKAILTDKIAMKSPIAAIEIGSPESSNMGIFDGAMAANVSAGFAFPSVSSSSADPVASSSQLSSMKGSSTGTPAVGFGDEVEMRKESNAASPPPMTFGDKDAPPKEANIFPIINKANGASSIFSFGSKNVNKAPDFSITNSYSVTEISGPKASESSITGSVENNNKSEETADNKRKMSSTLFNRTAENVSLVPNSTSSGGISPFAASINGSLGTDSSSSLVTSLFHQNGTGQSSLTLAASAPASTTINTGNNNNTSSFNSSSSSGLPASSVSAFPPVPIFKFASATSTYSDAELGAETRPSASFGMPSSSPTRSTPAVADTGSNIFGFTGPATKSSVNLCQGSSTFSIGSAVATFASSANAIPTDVGPATSSQRMPNQFGLSASVPSFSFGGNSAFSTSSSFSGSSVFGAKMSNAGNPLGQSSVSVVDAIFVSSSGSSNTVGASLQPAKSPFVGSVFSSSTGFGQSFTTASSTALTGSVFSSSTGFAFGASSASSSSTAFGSSTGSSMFSFTSSMPSTSSQPVYKGTNSTAAFCSKPLTCNDEKRMDGMAEDTVQASAPPPSTPVFGQQTVTSQPPAFLFGSSASSPSSPSPFQFGSQQCPSTPQNPVAFQPSGSLGINSAGGSFSLGTGGGDKSKRKIIKVKRGRK